MNTLVREQVYFDPEATDSWLILAVRMAIHTCPQPHRRRPPLPSTWWKHCKHTNFNFSHTFIVDITRDQGNIPDHGFIQVKNINTYIHTTYRHIYMNKKQIIMQRVVIADSVLTSKCNGTAIADGVLPDFRRLYLLEPPGVPKDSTSYSLQRFVLSRSSLVHTSCVLEQVPWLPLPCCDINRDDLTQ